MIIWLKYNCASKTIQSGGMSRKHPAGTFLMVAGWFN
jgi:hypothetical protein